MKNIAILIATAFLTFMLGGRCFAEDRKTEILAKEKQHQPIPFSQVQLGSELGARYMAAVCNILTRTDRYSLESFAACASSQPGSLWWDWPGDQNGRWLSVMHVAEGSFGWPSAVSYRKAVADATLPHQTKDGYFGKPGTLKSDDSRIPSGNAFALRGLMDAYADTHEQRYLDSARKLAHYFETIAPNWETSQVEIFDQSGQKQSFDVNEPGWDKREKGKLHEFYGHCIDGLVALYEQGGDQWALDFAKRLAKNVARTHHTHHALSLYRGLIDLARVTGDKQHLDKVEDYLTWCRENQLASGGLPEGMPVSPQDEGCGLADWIVVNMMMFQLTGEERYVDDAEHMLVNHFFMNQFHTGGFGHRTFSQEVVGGKLWQGWDGLYGSENPGCCSLWGAWALGQLSQYVVTQSGDMIDVNLYPTAEIKIPERGLRLEISSDFPRMTKACIRVECEKPQTFTLALRVPPWNNAMIGKCNGVAIEPIPAGRRANFLLREWKGTTNIEIEFKSAVRTVSWPVKNPKGVAVFDGPLCYGLSSNTANVDLPWAVLVDAAARPVLDSEGRPQAIDPASRKVCVLEPINAAWLTPDVKNPARRRILFQTQQAEKK
jgi:DUF1680 family protein